MRMTSRWPGRAPVLRAGLALALGLALAGCTRDVVADRFAKMPAQDDVVNARDWYRPTVTVRGAPRPWPGAGAGGVAATPGSGPAAPQARFAAALEMSRRYQTLALVVVQDGRIVLEDYAPGIAPGQRFDTQSMARGMLALVVGAALADGHIDSLDAKAARWIPEWSAPGDPRGQISIRDLLHGQSGLSEPRYENKVGSPGLAMFIGTDLRAVALGQTLLAPPGTKYRASTLDMQVLGLALERATGQSYGEYLSRRIWKPIGADDAQVQLDRPRGNTRTFCCLRATARDWARVGQLVIDRGRVDGRQLLPGSWIEQVMTPAPLNPAVGVYWFIKPTALVPSTVDMAKAPAAPTPFAAPGVAYAGGRGGQRLFVLPAQRAVIVRIGAMRYDFDDGQFANTFIAALDAR
jgi:CubicO group peptidase (beta-lactamase class C family)